MGNNNLKNANKTTGKPIGKAKKSGNAHKKTLVYVFSFIALALIGWLGFKLFGNNYKSNAMDMKTNAIVAERLALLMLNDFQENLIRAETDHSALNSENMVTSTTDTKQVVKWRQDYFKKNGATDLLEQLVKKIGDCYSNMKLTPARYRDTQENFKNIQEGIKELEKLTKEPGDSVVALAQNVSDIRARIESDLEPTDFNFFVSLDQIQSLTDNLASKISNKDIAEAIKNDASGKPSSALNMLKYKKMGFSELPKGKGVLYREVVKGKGPKPKDDTNVKLNYEGKLMDGTVFDSSYKRGQPVTMRPSQTVPGFWHSLTNMQAGSKWEIYIPYDQAYGERAAGAVKPYSDLFFTIEIIELEK